MPAARAYFSVCRVLGRLLRSGRYAKARIVDHDGQRQVRKFRLFYAPLLVWIGGPLMWLLDTGVRVLRQREWEEREQEVYRTLYGASIATDAGVLVLPCFRGETLAALLEDPTLEESARRDAIQRAVVALAEFHRRGFTHGDAMAENVLIDLESGVAHWFDFETVHDSSRSIAWRRADDVRALLVTCLVRTVPEKHAEILRLIVDVYADEEVTRVLATSFTSVFQRPLTFHLAQAGLSFWCFRAIARLLRDGGGFDQPMRPMVALGPSRSTRTVSRFPPSVTAKRIEFLLFHSPVPCDTSACRRRKMSDTSGYRPPQNRRVSRRVFLHSTSVIPAALASPVLVRPLAAMSATRGDCDMVAGQSCESRLPIVAGVPLQPLVAQVTRLIGAAEYLGAPFPPDHQRELEVAFKMTDEESAVTLDPARARLPLPCGG